MTYGWGADKQAGRAMFDLYRERGGNFFDTADLYAGGESETRLGEFVHEARVRDEVVIATKFSFNAQAGNPNAGGNGRKNIFRALEGSLRRLQTDYVDLYILHAWDRVTPVEEVRARDRGQACLLDFVDFILQRNLESHSKVWGSSPNCYFRASEKRSKDCEGLALGRTPSCQ
jgi:predicted aldo/keto reductase-like oxidoreductase